MSPDQRLLQMIETERRVADAADRAESAALNMGGGGGTLPPMDAVDAKIAAAEARTDTKFAELRADLRGLPNKAEMHADASSLRNNVWGAALTALAITLAVVAFGGDRFDAGMGAGSAVAPIVEQQKARDAAQDKKLDEILSRLPKQ